MSTYTNTEVSDGLSTDTEEKEDNDSRTIIDVTIGVFFDGTLNNKYNIDHDKDIDDSYIGTYTNVAELYESYTESILKVYDYSNNIKQGGAYESSLEKYIPVTNSEALYILVTCSAFINYVRAKDSTKGVV